MAVCAFFNLFRWIRSRGTISYESLLREGFLRIPFVLPGIFAVVFTVISSLVVLIDLHLLSGKSTSILSVLLMFCRFAFDRLVSWENPVHFFSLMTGILLYLSFIWAVHSEWNNLRLSVGKVTGLIVAGSAPVYAYAILQMLKIVPAIHTIGISGTFQNNNHLSFYAGLVALLSWGLFKNHSLKPFWALCALVSMFFLVLGMGRVSWIMFVAVAMFLAAAHLKSSWDERKENKSSLVRGLIVVTAPVFILAFTVFAVFESHQLSVQIGEILNLAGVAREKGLLHLFFVGGREEQLLYVLKQIREHFWLGSGLGNFFLKSDLDYELHFSYLIWPYGMGVAGLIAMLTGAGAFLVALKHIPWKKIFNDGMGLALISAVIYIAGTHIPDIFISYRSLLAVVMLIFLVFLRYFPDAFRQRSESYYWLVPLIVFLGVAGGSLTILVGQDRVPLTRTWYNEKSEHEKFESFNWVSLAHLDQLSNRSCYQYMVLQRFQDQVMPFVVGSYAIPPEADVTLSELAEWERVNLADSTVLGIWPHIWNKVCVCRGNYAGSGTGLYLRGGSARIRFLSDPGRPKDFRLLSFAIADKKVSGSIQDLDEQGADSCDHIVYF